jgi:hypothetical protein
LSYKEGRGIDLKPASYNMRDRKKQSNRSPRSIPIALPAMKTRRNDCDCGEVPHRLLSCTPLPFTARPMGWTSNSKCPDCGFIAHYPARCPSIPASLPDLVDQDIVEPKDNAPSGPVPLVDIWAFARTGKSAEEDTLISLKKVLRISAQEFAAVQNTTDPRAEFFKALNDFTKAFVRFPFIS